MRRLLVVVLAALAGLLIATPAQAHVGGGAAGSDFDGRVLSVTPAMPGVSVRVLQFGDDLELVNSPRGTRTTFLLDKAIGYEASGITMAMFELGPGRGQSMHRHPGEAWLYVLEGEGHSYLGTEPEGGTNHPWKKGDLIVVDHFLWHQHFNDSDSDTARYLAIQDTFTIKQLGLHQIERHPDTPYDE